MRRVAAVAAGEEALRLADGRALKAAAVFGRSLYLEDDAGNMLCALSDSLEPGPLHLNCAGWPADAGRYAARGDEFVAVAGTLRSRTFAIDFSEAAVWRPSALPAEANALAGKALGAVLDAARRLAPRDTLLAACLFPENADAGAMSPALLAEARKGVRALADGSPEAAEILVGLGPGLTPSGDDMLAGALFALRVFEMRDRADRLAESVLRLLHRTNRVSAAHLRAAAKGLAAAAFHDLASTAAAGRDPATRLMRVGGIGHTSGWDALLGMLAAGAIYGVLNSDCKRRVLWYTENC